MFEFLLNLFFPPKCPVCGGVVKKRGNLCKKCLDILIDVRKIRKKSQYIKEFRAITIYKGGARGIIRELKFDKKKFREKTFNFILEKADSLIRKYPRGILAVIVPISEKRMKERGFNQVELMFRAWLKKRKIRTADILIRKKATEHQYGLNVEERKENVKDAFYAAKHLEGEDILLLDDILTTGATVEECAKTLKEAGAGKIFALSFSSDG